MKKDELKKAFENKFNDIKVSEELKNKTLEAINKKTLEAINKKTLKTSHIPYIKNFAAIFVVTLLCISIYYSHDFPKKAQIQQDSEIGVQNNTEQSINNDITKEKTLRYNIQIPSSINSDVNYGATDSLNSVITESLPQKSIMHDDSTENSTIENDYISEQDFIKLYPNATKTKDGYAVYENNQKVLYILKNGMLRKVN